MSFKHALVHWKPTLVGFAIGLLIVIAINYFIYGFVINLSAILFGLLGATLAALATTRIPEPEWEVNPTLITPTDQVTEAQLYKTTLEIRDLSRRSHWEQRVARYLPPMTIAVAVTGLLIGLYQFKTQQRSQHEQDMSERKRDLETREREQGIRLQDQMRTDVERILRFANDKEQTVSTASFLLMDLKTLLGSKVSETERVKDIYRDYERGVTLNLLRMIKYECDFSRNKRDIDFTIAVVDNWEDYPIVLKGDVDSLEKLLHMHIRAIRRLRDDNPGYFESMKNKADGYDVPPRFDKQAVEERRYQHFLATKTGFLRHLELLEDDSSEPARNLRELALREFELALANKEISDDILGRYLKR